MDVLRTDRTYKTRENAMKALFQACEKLDVNIDRVRYLIAVNDEGRFAPVVVNCSDPKIADFPSTWAHNGVTVLG